MKRQWSFEIEEPDEESHRLALALGAVAGPEFVRSVLDCYTTMSRIGGEAYIGTYRDKFREENVTDEQGRQLVDEFNQPLTRLVKVESNEIGEWHTLGFMFHYEHVAKLTGKVTKSEREPDDRLTKPRPLTPEPAEADHTEADREAKEAIEEVAA